jgi:Kef-type K+ transport system membrane component KefB
MKRNIFLYLLIISGFAFLTWFVIDKGSYLSDKNIHKNQTGLIVDPSTIKKTVAIIPDATESVQQQFISNIQSPLSLLLLQILVILIVSRIFGFLFSKIGQPSVVGEMVAGLFLGPSIVGLFFPHFSEFIFPKDSLKTLQFLSQIGLTFFMFIIGMELEKEKLRHKAKNAVVISHASIIIPFFLGVTLSYFIYEKFAPEGVRFLAFALFMGIAMSITAFPVLARIVQERGLTKTPLGAMVITCAAADDVTAWCILACVIAIVKAGSILSALFTIVLAFLFVVVMLFFIRPLLKKLGQEMTAKKIVNKAVISLSFFILLISAYLSEIIGIHALFGAFLAGVIMPNNLELKKLLAEKLEDISVLILLPIFFVFTGLRTQIGLLNEGHLWATCLLVIFIAVIGKFGGSSLTARLIGQSWKDSLSIGALMNTRGLMELIVLNIGYDLGVLSPEIFAIMVLMALSTTFMTGPLLNLINYFSNKRQV